MLAKWPGPILEGNGERLIIIDDHATEDQRNALEKIVSGEDTVELATIFWVINAMTTIRHKTLYLPIKIEADMEARTGLVLVDGVFELNVEPIKNAVTGAEH
tara:strand:+ start:3127 stop:3432 length:306 start_codon:yes stop_codon:yes gene_type:complete